MHLRFATVFCTCLFGLLGTLLALMGVGQILDERVKFEGHGPTLRGYDAVRVGFGTAGVGAYLLIWSFLFPLWPTLQGWRFRHHALNALGLLCTAATFVLSCPPWLFGRDIVVTTAWAPALMLACARSSPRAARGAALASAFLAVCLAFFLALVLAAFADWGKPILLGLLAFLLAGLGFWIHLTLMTPRGRLAMLSSGKDNAPTNEAGDPGA